MQNVIEIMGEKLLTQGGLATEFSVSRATLRRWAKEGIGPKSLKLGGRRLYPEEAVKQFLKSQIGE